MGLLQTRQVLKALHKQQKLGIALGISCNARFPAQLCSLWFVWHNRVLESAALAESDAWAVRDDDFFCP